MKYAYLLVLALAPTLARAADPQAWDALTFHAAPKPLPAGAVTHDWPCFLGPTHNNVSSETKILDAFPAEGPAIVWEAKRGTGYCAPAISNGRLVMLHRIGGEECVDCLDPETGKRFWHFAYPSNYQDRYGYCDGPRAAPVIDAGLVYTYGAEGKLHCLDLQTGQLKWKHDLLDEFKVEQNFFGVGATPLVEGDVVIVNVGAAPKGPCVVAFNKVTGELAWKTDEKRSNAWGPSYASPIPATVNGKRRVFVFAGGESRPPTGGLVCLDPATGAVDFSFPWRSKHYESVNASSPVVLDGNRVFISECYGAGSAFLELAQQDLQPKLLWKTERLGTHFMTAIAKDGYLYGVDGHGPGDNALVCLNLATGDDVWRKELMIDGQIPTKNGPPLQRKMSLARCSLLLVEGRFLCLGEYGQLLWLDLSPQGCKITSQCWPFAAQETWTSPVLSHGLLYVCQNNESSTGAERRLICFDLRGK